MHTLFVFLVHGPGLATLPAPAYNFGDIFFGQHDTLHAQAIAGVLALIVAIFAIYALTSRWSLRAPRQVQRWLGYVLNPTVRRLLGHLGSRQEMKPADISPYHIINGISPTDPAYLSLLWTGFRDWRLEIGGLVEQPLVLTLDDLQRLPRQEYVIRHNCIQGWSGIAAWAGVPFSEILARCRPLPEAKYVVFWSYGEDTEHNSFYEVLSLTAASHRQTILAYEMNQQPLSVPHGAPLRLRCETQLGYKMVKWLRSIEFVEDYSHLRGGTGGSREDNRYYEQPATI